MNSARCSPETEGKGDAAGSPGVPCLAADVRRREGEGEEDLANHFRHLHYKLRLAVAGVDVADAQTWAMHGGKRPRGTLPHTPSHLSSLVASLLLLH